MPIMHDIMMMVHNLRWKIVQENCLACLYDCPSQRDHSCVWDNGEDYKMEALVRLYGQDLITEEEYSEAINYL